MEEEGGREEVREGGGAGESGAKHRHWDAGHMTAHMINSRNITSKDLQEYNSATPSLAGKNHTYTSHVSPKKSKDIASTKHPPH